MIRAASLRGFAPLVEELGADVGQLFDRFGVSREAVASDDALIPLTAHDLMLDTAAEELGCPDLGLRLSASQDLSVLGPLALAIEASSTVAEALKCASRFMFVHSPALGVAVEPDRRGSRGVVALTYRKDLRESPYSPQGIELGLGLFHHIGRVLVGEHLALRSVEIPHQPLSPVSRYTGFFGADVKFGSPEAALRVERRLLDARFASANEAIRRVAVDYLAAHYADPGARTSARVRLALAESLGTTAPVMVNVARLLAMHPRSLQRRLADEHTTFEGILDDVRREAAHRYITTTQLPLGQVASLVGFSEQSALSRAVRRWHGLSPRELRRAGPTRTAS